MLAENIISERLIIRDMTEDDAIYVWKIWSSIENEKYMGDPVNSLEEVMSICKSNMSNKNYLIVAVLKETGEVIGTCCFGNTNKNNEWGFGYSIKEEHWGKGYATETVKAVIRFGESLGITDFISDCAIENSASSKVLEKCGMTLDCKSSFKQPKSNIVYESYVYKLHKD